MSKSTSQWSGSPSVRGTNEAVSMILLTFSLVGISFCWSLEGTYCTPYLLSLGLSKSKTSLVFIAGPLSGLIMQPIVGTVADRSTSRYGRRRPVMVVGVVVVGISLLMLGWTKEVVAVFAKKETYHQNATIITAVLLIYMVDFAINAVQACCRSLIVDTLPITKQQIGSAWATRVGGAANLVSYGIGTLDLVAVVPSLLPGDTQFKKMTVISVVVLWLTTGVTCYSVTERVLISSPDHKTSILGILPTLWQRIFNLPPRIKAICWVQFWAWIGWFPFLFYSSTWVGETYYRYEHIPDPNEDQHDALGNIGRLGSLALVLFSIVSFAGAIVLPGLVRSVNFGSREEEHYTPRPPSSLPRSMGKLITTLSALPKPDLVTAWQMAHLCFAFIMVWSPFVRSIAAATLVVALCGVPWAVGGWAPFTEMGIEINKLGMSDVHGGRQALHGGYRAVRSSIDDDNIELTAYSAVRARSSSVLRLSHPNTELENGSTGELAGVYLGVLNVYTTLPQFVGTFIGWVVFSIFEPDRSEGSESNSRHHSWLDTSGINGISVCFFIGAVSAVVAAEATRRLKKLS